MQGNACESQGKGGTAGQQSAIGIRTEFTAF
jgi:hypothetical protein